MPVQPQQATDRNDKARFRTRQSHPDQVIPLCPTENQQQQQQQGKPQNAAKGTSAPETGRRTRSASESGRKMDEMVINIKPQIL
jgi:hypothetical protein